MQLLGFIAENVEDQRKREFQPGAQRKPAGRIAYRTDHAAFNGNADARQGRAVVLFAYRAGDDQHFVLRAEVNGVKC